MEDLPEASLVAIAQYGFQRFINDRANKDGREGTTEAKHAIAKEVYTQLVAGWVGRIAKPKASTEDKIAAELLAKALRVKGINKKSLGDEKWAGALAGFKIKFAKQIAEEVARRNAMDVDLDGILGV